MRLVEQRKLKDRILREEFDLPVPTLAQMRKYLERQNNRNIRMDRKGNITYTDFWKQTCYDFAGYYKVVNDEIRRRDWPKLSNRWEEHFERNRHAFIWIDIK